MMLFYRGVAQLVAHLVWDQRVAGSSPVTPTNIMKPTDIIVTQIWLKDADFRDLVDNVFSREDLLDMVMTTTRTCLLILYNDDTHEVSSYEHEF